MKKGLELLEEGVVFEQYKLDELLSVPEVDKVQLLLTKTETDASITPKPRLEASIIEDTKSRMSLDDLLKMLYLSYYLQQILKLVIQQDY